MPSAPQPQDHRAAAVAVLNELLLAGDTFRQSAAAYFGIGATETAAVTYLSSYGELGQTELARHLRITTSAATSLIDRLSANGLVQRCPHPGDRRRIIVRLTAAGDEAIRQARSWYRGAFEQVPDRDLLALTDLLRTLIVGLREHAEIIPSRAESDPAAGSAGLPPTGGTDTPGTVIRSSGDLTV